MLNKKKEDFCEIILYAKSTLVFLWRRSQRIIDEYNIHIHRQYLSSGIVWLFKGTATKILELKSGQKSKMTNKMKFL